jgi:hypothetical protein
MTTTPQTASGPALSLKESIWLACKQKNCCYTAMVVPTGRDIWRIVRTLEAPPWSFLVYFRTPRPYRDAFLLDRNGPPYRLMLAKQPSRRTKEPAPCIFLLRTREGYHRCGLGELRPMVCQTFPVDMTDGILRIQGDTGCTCRAWALTDLGLARERALVEQRQADGEEYCAIVARWNEQVEAAPPGTIFEIGDFCDYLLAAYDQLAAQASAGGAA